MTLDFRALLRAVLCVTVVTFGPSALAQDEAGEPDEASVPVKPRDSQTATLAARSLLLGIVNTGKHLIAVGDRGHIVASNDGANWAQVQTPVRATLTDVDFVDEKHGWAVGHDAVILATQDAGRTWQLQNFQPELEKPFMDVLFLDAKRGMAVGAYGLFMVTADGGATWSELDAPPIREEELHFNDLVKLGNGELLIVGETGMMGISIDGTTWERLESPYEGSAYGAVPRGERGALIFGLRGNVYQTDDVRGGQWTEVDTGTVASFFGGAVLSDGRVALVGLAGEVAVIGTDGRVRLTRIDAMAGVTGSGTLSAAAPWNGGLLVVGELGVSTVGL